MSDASRRSDELTLPATVSYRAERPFWPWRGREFHLYDATGGLVGYVHNPVLELRDEVVIYADVARTRPLARLKARQIVSLQMTYDVSTGSIALGALRARGLRSLLRSTWDILDAEDQPIGTMVERGWAPLRRLLPLPLPLGRWEIECEGQTVGRVRQVFHLFRREYLIKLNSARIDPRFGIACVVLVLMAETSRGV